MGLMAIDVMRDGSLSGDGALARHLATLPTDAPVIVMVHGYKYDPAVTGRSPHATLFSATAGSSGRGLSWAAALGASEGSSAPLCIGFGWPARGSVWQAWDMAAQAARPLAGLLTRIAARGRRAHLIAHSMGARVSLQAIAQAPAESVDRVVLLSGAAHRRDARAALASPAGRSVSVVNVSGRENALFDALTEAMTGLSDRSIGRGWDAGDPRWMDLRLDQAETIAALCDNGFRVAADTALICHWSSYTRPGVFGLYRALLANRALPLDRLLRIAHTPSRPSRTLPPVLAGAATP